MPGKGIAHSARRSTSVIRASFSLGVLLVFSCGGGSKFTGSGDGDAGESSSGGSSSGAAGVPNGGGGSVATGGVAGTSPTGGRSTGGFSGTAATGGTDSVGGDGGMGAESGSSSGGSELGGTAGVGSGGSGGQTGGFSGVGGATSDDCPLRPPSGMCEPNGLVCRYSNATQCLCVSPQPGTSCTPDPRCPLLLDRLARVIIDAGILPDGGNPIPTQTCTCVGEMWSCTLP